MKTKNEIKYNRTRLLSLALLFSIIGITYHCRSNPEVKEYFVKRVSTLAGNGVAGMVDGTPAIDTQFAFPSGVAVDSLGNVYVADTKNHRIRKISSSGVVSTLAGNGLYHNDREILRGGFRDGDFATEFASPSGVAVDSLGNVYVADTKNHRIRKISSSGVVSTLAGNGVSQNGREIVPGGFKDGTPAIDTQFASPSGVAVDSLGNVYVADTDNHRIRKISSSGVVSTLAGNGVAGMVDGVGTTAQFNGIKSIAIDAAGIIYVADSFKSYSKYSSCIRKITVDGFVSTLVCSVDPGETSALKIGHISRPINIDPVSIAVDNSGTIYYFDNNQNCLYKITVDGFVHQLTSGLNRGFQNGEGRIATFNRSRGMAIDAAGIIYVADTDNHSIRKIEQ